MRISVIMDPGMRKTVQILGFTLAFLDAGSVIAEVSPTSTASNATLLRNYAAAQCISLAYDDPVVKADAQDAVGAYVEFGSVAVEAYEQITVLATSFLTRKYASKSGGKLQLMKCLDLLNSPELAALVAQHTRHKR